MDSESPVAVVFKISLNVMFSAQGALTPNDMLRDGAVTGLFSHRVHGSGEKWCQAAGMSSGWIHQSHALGRVA